MSRASVFGVSLVLAVLAAGCRPSHPTDHRNTKRVNNLGHHSSNEDAKMLGHQVSQFDIFANKLFGRYRGESGELVLCNTVIDTHARALYLERSVGPNIVERRLFLADPIDDPDSIQEYELLRAPPAVACHGLPLELPPDIVGRSLRSWTMPTSTVDWNGPPGSFFVQTTIDGKTIRYERAGDGMVRVVARDREEFRTLHRTRDGVWYVPESTTPDDTGQVDVTTPEATQADAACVEHSCPAGTQASVQRRPHAQYSCTRRDGTLHGPVLVCAGESPVLEGEWEDGKRSGRWKLHGTDGQVLAEGNYKDGQREGRWVWRNLTELAKATEMLGLLGAVSFKAWQHGGTAKRVSEADDLIQNLLRGPVRSVQGEFKDGQLHGSWKTFGENDQLISERRFDRGFLMEHCGSEGGSQCTRFLRWRQVAWSCQLPSGPARLFRSKSQLGRAVPCAVDELGMKAGEFVIAIPGAGRVIPSTRLRVQAKGKTTEVEADIDYLCGGARRVNEPNTLWLVVTKGKRALPRLGAVKLDCQPTP